MLNLRELEWFAKEFSKKDGKLFVLQQLTIMLDVFGMFGLYLQSVTRRSGLCFHLFGFSQSLSLS